MSLLDHLNELRKRIASSIIAIGLGTSVAFFLYPYIMDTIITPFQNNIHAEFGKQLYINSIFEGFLTKFKLSIITGIVLSFPVHLYNFVRFVYPGLKRKEKWAVSLGLVSSFFLIVGSCYLSFIKLVPFILKFMTSSGFIPNDVGLLLNFEHSIFYIVQFVFYSLILFQIPILLEIMLALDMVSRRTLLRSSRYVIIGIFMLSALVTPPDVISQVSISCPLIILYFLTIGIAKVFKWGELPCSD